MFSYAETTTRFLQFEAEKRGMECHPTQLLPQLSHTLSHVINARMD